MINSLYGNMRTRSFAEIFPAVTDFIEAYRDSGLNTTEMTNENLKILYFLLYAQYGNSHIASSDENQFQYKMWSIIYTQGPIWQKNLSTQERLRDLKEEEILRTSKYISSHAYNPGVVGERIDGEGDHILDYINDQNATTEKGSYLASLTAYMEALQDVCGGFIAQFKSLFVTIVNPEVPLWYVED